MKISQHVIWGKFAIQLWATVVLGVMVAPAAAQIVPDQTLGAEGSRATSNVLIRGASGDLIEGGAVRGSNLFHSFQQFNVNGNQRVYFANPVGVQTIFSRVTGSNASNILGTLGVDGNANLFLLNPNGILFGKNAQLDIRGSFLATTADRFTFPDGSTFGASNPQAAPLLTMSAPVGVQYGQVPGTITNQGNLATGQNLTLAANNLDLQGQMRSGGDLTLQAQDTVRIRDSATQPFTATAGSKLLIQGDRSIDIFALNHPASGFFSGSDLILRSANTVGGDAHFQSRGNFRIEQMDGTAGSLFSPHDPIILADGDVTLSNYTGASLHILAGGSVTLGSVSITGAGNTNDTINPDNPDPFLASLATVPLSNGNKILIDGRNSTLDVRAGVDWSQFPNFPGNTGIGTPAPLATPATSANIAVGKVDFDSDSGGTVFLSNQFFPNKSLPGASEISVGSIDTGGHSEGGDIVIDARDRLTTQGLLITSAFSANGKSGNVLLRADGDLQVMDDINTAAVDENNQNSLLGTSGNVNVWAGGNLTLNPGTNILVNGIVGGDVILRSNGNIRILNNLIDATSNNAGNNSGDPYSAVEIESLQGSVSLSGATVNVKNDGAGFAGDLFIDAAKEAKITSSNLTATGYFGRILIGSSSAPQTLTINHSNLKNSSSSGDAGAIEIHAKDSTSISNSNVEGLNLGSGKGSSINIDTGSLAISNNTTLDASTFGSGDAGNIKITVPGSTTVQKSQIVSSVNKGAEGNAGNITIRAGDLSLIDGGAVLALIDEEGSGNAGDVDIGVQRGIILSGTDSRIENSIGKNAEGQGGKTTIQAEALTISDGAKLEASTQGTGNAGDVKITADRVLLQKGDIRSDVKAGAIGDAGDITINAKTFTMASPDASSISTRITGRVDSGGTGNGGDITINANSAQIDNSAISFSTSGKGNAGILTINAQDLTLRSDAAIVGDVGNGGNGQGGNIRLNVAGTLLMDGITDPGVNIAGSGESTRITAGIGPNGAGQGGEIQIQAGTFLMQNGAIIKNSTRGAGNAGAVKITAGQVNISGSVPQSGLPSGLFTSTTTNYRAGEIAIDTGTLQISNGSALNAQSTGNGIGGNITVNATKQFEALAGGQLITSTFGAGAAGNIQVTAPQVTIAGQDPLYTQRLAKFPNPIDPGVANAITETGSSSGLFANAIASSSTTQLGKGGDIRLSASNVLIQNNAGLKVDSRSGNLSANAASSAGSIEINAKQLKLDNSAFINAETDTGSGGNIQISARDLLLMRRNSVISTTAGSPGKSGNGGNIRINAPKGFIVAVPKENSDIIANAFGGKGGKISISANRILGFTQRSRLTPNELKAIRTNGISDISASSDVGADGDISTSTLQVDPSQGLTEIPVDLVDPSSLIAQNCQPGSTAADRRSEFVITGRGGLPPSPGEAQSSDAVSVPWVSSSSSVSQRLIRASVAPPIAEPLVEAQGITIAANGTAFLTTQVTTAPPHLSRSLKNLCASSNR